MDRALNDLFFVNIEIVLIFLKSSSELLAALENSFLLSDSFLRSFLPRVKCFSEFDVLSSRYFDVKDTRDCFLILVPLIKNRIKNIDVNSRVGYHRILGIYIVLWSLCIASDSFCNIWCSLFCIVDHKFSHLWVPQRIPSDSFCEGHKFALRH